MKRRKFIKSGVAAVGAVAGLPSVLRAEDAIWEKFAVQIYSFNHALKQGKLDILEFPKTVVEGTGIKGLEYYNGFMMDLAGDKKFFEELRRRGDDLGAHTTLTLCKSTKPLDDPNPLTRIGSVQELKPWLEATKILGGDTIRVDCRSGGDPEENIRNAADGLNALGLVAEKMEMDIVVENHGAHSSNGAWMVRLMDKVDRENVGTLPDFQNFGDYDPYQGVAEMMPWARKYVCAKSKAFGTDGEEENVDYERLMGIVLDAGFDGTIGIEFEGETDNPLPGIRATRRLVEKSVAAWRSGKGGVTVDPVDPGNAKPAAEHGVGKKAAPRV